MKWTLLLYLLFSSAGLWGQINQNSMGSAPLENNTLDGENAPMATPLAGAPFTLQTSDWYQKQAAIWYTFTQQNPQQPVGWENLSKALYFGNGTQAAKQQCLQQMKPFIENTYAYYLSAFLLSETAAEKATWAPKLWETGKNNPEIYPYYLRYYAEQGKSNEVDEALKHWNSHKLLAPVLNEFAEHQLSTAPAQSILLVDGDFDTYPLWMIQRAQKRHTQVAVIHWPLLQFAGYQKLVKSWYGLDLPTERKLALWLGAVQKQYPQRKLLLSVTIQAETLKAITGKYTLAGLFYAYESSETWGTTQSIELWEKYASTLQASWGKNNVAPFEIGLLHRVIGNYIPSGLQYYAHLKSEGHEQQAEKITQTLRAWAKRIGKEKAIESLLNR